MKLVSDKDNIIFLKGDNQYELSSTFMRLQEFYESPKFKGEVFDLEEYMDWYASEYGNFTYTKDWNGFNVPGHIVAKFFEEFDNILLRKEKNLLEMVASHLGRTSRFYVIGSHGENTTSRDVMRHEYAHAFFYLNQQYKKEQEELVMKLPKLFRNNVYKWLEESGYHEYVFVDECQAYLSTNQMIETAEDFGEDAPWDTILKMQQTFQKYFDQHNAEDDG